MDGGPHTGSPFPFLHHPSFSWMTAALFDAIAVPMKVIETTAALEAACTRLANADYISVDTEFLRTNTYWPILCLIQVAGPDPEDAYIIDPLAPGISM